MEPGLRRDYGSGGARAEVLVPGLVQGLLLLLLLLLLLCCCCGLDWMAFLVGAWIGGLFLLVPGLVQGVIVVAAVAAASELLLGPGLVQGFCCWCLDWCRA